MRVLYGVLAAINLVNAVISLRFLKETSIQQGQDISMSNLKDVFREIFGGIPSTLRQLPVTIKAMAVVMVLGFMSNSVAGPFWVVFAIDRIGLSSVEWGTILFFETALRTILSIPVGLLVDRYGRTRSLVASMALALVSIPMFIMSKSFVHALVIRLSIAVINAFFSPASTALMADLIPREIRGRVMAALGRGTMMVGASGGGSGGPGMGFIISIPVILSSIAGGFLYAINPTYPWIFAFFSYLASIIVLALYVRDPKQAYL
jgi:MFS family permease